MLDLKVFLLGGNTTTLALALDIAMESNTDAQARYRAIYGVEWAPVTEDALVTLCTRSSAPSTSAITCR